METEDAFCKDLLIVHKNLDATKGHNRNFSMDSWKNKKVHPCSWITTLELITCTRRPCVLFLINHTNTHKKVTNQFMVVNFVLYMVCNASPCIYAMYKKIIHEQELRPFLQQKLSLIGF